MAVASLFKDKETIVPTVDELAARAQSLIPNLRQNARAVEQAGRVSAEMIRTLNDLDLLTVTKPARFGGLELGPTALMRIGFELGRGCGSTAWCASIANCCAWYAASLPLQAQQDIWGKTPDALVSSGGVPTGKAKVAEGGYTTWGRWAFASNGDNADWFLNGSMILGEEGEPPRPAWFLLHKSQIKIDHESWDVSGMQGTGSKTVYSDEPIFVPEHRMLFVDDLLKGVAPGTFVPDNLLAHYFFSTFGGMALAAPILGIAQGALDVFVENIKAKSKVRFGSTPGGPLTGADSPFIQQTAGRAAVLISSTYDYVMTVLKEAEAKISIGEKLTIAERIRIRSASTLAAKQAVEAVNLLAAYSGANSASHSNPIQRYWRDANTGARHMGLDDTAIYPLYGQLLFGMEPVGLF